MLLDVEIYHLDLHCLSVSFKLWLSVPQGQTQFAGVRGWGVGDRHIFSPAPFRVSGGCDWSVCFQVRLHLLLVVSPLQQMHCVVRSIYCTIYTMYCIIYIVNIPTFFCQQKRRKKKRRRRTIIYFSWWQRFTNTHSHTHK